MKLKRKLPMVLIVLMAVFCILLETPPGHGSDTRGVTETTVKVGTIGDFTGPIARTWHAALKALKNYFRHVNESGGIHGRQVKNIVEDDRYSIPMALSAFKKLIFRDKTLILFAASGIGHTHAIIPLAEKHKVPMIAQTNDRKYFNPVKPYIFTGLPFYEDQIELIFEYIFNDMKEKNPVVALAYPDTASGNISRDLCRKLSKVYNVKKYSETIITVGAGDFSSQILHLKRLKPAYVIIHGYIGSTSAFLRDAYKLRFNSTFIGIQYGCVNDTVKLAGATAERFIGTNAFASWEDDTSGMARVRKVVKQYRTETDLLNRNYLNGWIASILIHKALENAGKDVTPEAVVKGFEAIKDYDTEGICGIMSYGPNDHKPIDYSKFYKADTEKAILVPITGWRKPSTNY